MGPGLLLQILQTCLCLLQVCTCPNTPSLDILTLQCLTPHCLKYMLAHKHLPQSTLTEQKLRNLTMAHYLFVLYLISQSILKESTNLTDFKSFELTSTC